MAANQQLWTRKRVDWKRFLPNYHHDRPDPEELERRMWAWGRRYNAALAAREKKSGQSPPNPPAKPKKPRGK